jgi:putative transposase
VLRRILQADNLLALRRRKFVRTTNSAHGFTVHPNAAQYVIPTAINQLWVSDITYLRLGNEFVFLAVVLDVFSRRIVGWELGRSLQSLLPLAALNKAIESRNPSPGLVHHSDRGSQYASDDYVSRLESMQMVISMSRPGCPWENGFCESLINTLKTEQLNCLIYATLEDLRQHIEEFIENFYNTERLHSALGYCSPIEFERAAASSRPATMSFPRHKEIYPDA